MLSDKRVFEIRERSIVSAGRLALTKEYATIHYGCESYDLDGPRMIVVHYTAFDTLETSWRFMAPDELSEIRDDIRKGGALNVGAHYMIDRTGDILRLIPDHIMARHTIGFNHVSPRYRKCRQGSVSSDGRSGRGRRLAHRSSGSDTSDD